MRSPREDDRRWVVGAVLCVAVLLLAGLTVAAEPRGSSAIGPPVAAPRALGASGTGDDGDWPTYLHDANRSDDTDGAVAFGTKNISAVQALWTFSAGGPIIASPILVNGTIYLGAWNGDEYAVNASDGAMIWSTYLGLANGSNCPHLFGVSSTPTYSAGTLYLGGGDGRFYAVNASTGSIDWSLLLGPTSSGYYLWSSPLLFDGSAYMGVASGCDMPLVPGGLAKIDLRTGLETGFFKTTFRQQHGGSIWSSPALDLDHDTIIVTTGNGGLRVVSPYTDAILALNASTLALESSWQVPTWESTPDGDFGATPTPFVSPRGVPLVVATDKNGWTYAWNLTNLSRGPLWSDRLSSPDATPIVSPASYDGHALYVPGLNVTIGGVRHPGGLFAVDPDTGRILWSAPLGSVPFTAPTVADGMVFLTAGHHISARASSTGKLLWQFTADRGFESPVVVTRDRILAGTLAGTLYAIGARLGAAASATPSTGAAPLAVQFQVSPTGGSGTYQYLWDFGDGLGATTANPMHSYVFAGDYNVTVQVQDSLGGTTTVGPILVTVTTPPAAPTVPRRR